MIDDYRITELIRNFLFQVLPHGDAVFQGHIVGNVLNVTKVIQGSLNIGDQVLGRSVPLGIIIVDFISGRGNVGTYQLSEVVPEEIEEDNLSTFVDVVRSQDNRVPQPLSYDFIVMTPFSQNRLSLNSNEELLLAEGNAIGAIDRTILVTDVVGEFTVGKFISGPGLQPRTIIVDVSNGYRSLDYLITETGFKFGLESGVGSILAERSVLPPSSERLLLTESGYPFLLENGSGRILVEQENTIPLAITVNKHFSRDVIGNSVYSAVSRITQRQELNYQLDVYGPNSGFNSSVISTLFRSSEGYNILDPDKTSISVLFNEDPEQVSFTDGEQQFEIRWMIMLTLQGNLVTELPIEKIDGIDVVKIKELT